MSLFFFVTNREFYYIQMEKYSRQLLSEGLVNAEDIHISADSELFRVLNLHYNRNNHIDVSYYNFFLFFFVFVEDGKLRSKFARNDLDIKKVIAFIILGAPAIHLRRDANNARILQGDSSGQRCGTELEESHLQDYRSSRRTSA